jgi:hypothetical protein
MGDPQEARIYFLASEAGKTFFLRKKCLKISGMKM